MKPMKTRFYSYVMIVLTIIFLFQSYTYSQIDDIKKNSKENKDKKSNFRDDSGSDSDNDGGLGQSILEGCFSGCVDIGCSIFAAVIADYTAKVYTLKPEDPSILSFDMNAWLAPAWHFSNGDTYKYYCFQPGFRAHLVSFMIDFRYNLLAEFDNDLPNTFKTWDLIVAFNIVPSKKFRLSIGTGVQREIYGALYFHEYYLGSRIGLQHNRNFLDIEFRCSADYETGKLPFIDTGLRYNIRFMDLNRFYGYFSLGLFHQNYYQAHEVYGIKGGLVFNWH